LQRHVWTQQAKRIEGSRCKSVIRRSAGLVRIRFGPYDPEMTRRLFSIIGLASLAMVSPSWPAWADGGAALDSSIAIGLLIAAIAGYLGFSLIKARRDRADAEQRFAKLEAEAAKLRDLLDLVPAPIWWSDKNHALRYGNSLFHQIAELEKTDPSGPTVQAIRQICERALSTGKDQTESLQAVVGGEPRTFSLTIRPLAGGVGVVATDLSVLETLQTDLSRHISANADVLESLRTAIGIYGPDRRLRFANTAFAKLWALDKAWLEAEPTIAEILEALREKRRLPEYADFPEFKRAQLALFQSLIERREELLHLPDEKTLRMVVTPHLLGGLIFSYEDVTDSLALERSYNTLIDVQRETLDNLHEGVAVFGTDGRLKLWNPAFAQIWQIPGGALDAAPTFHQFLDLIGPLFDQSVWEGEKKRILNELLSRLPRRGIDTRADGSHIQYTSMPLPDGANLYTFLDVTNRERVERALRERNQALENADRLKTEFIANVSYELRTPLNTIMGFAEILANQYFGELTPRQTEYASGILDSSQRLLSLINDILDLASIEAGYMSLNLAETDLHALLANALALTRERARSQQLSLQFDCAPNIGSIEADGRRLKQVVFNLLTNSCNFTPPGGTVTLSARRQPGEVVISVSDTGVGIPEIDQTRVWERFERGPVFGRQRGAGLGLSLVRSFVELHGGALELVSTPNRGTTVSCHLPERGAAEAPKLSRSA
jgi:signal transduction histidine kinase